MPFHSTNCAVVSKCLFSNEKGLSLLSQVSVYVDYNSRGFFRGRSKWPARHSGDHSPHGCLQLELLIQSTMSQQVPAERAGRMEGQWKGSAVVLNDCMGLNLLGQGRTGSGCLSDSEASVRAGCTEWCGCEVLLLLCCHQVHEYPLLPVYNFGVLVSI